MWITIHIISQFGKLLKQVNLAIATELASYNWYKNNDVGDSKTECEDSDSLLLKA